MTAPVDTLAKMSPEDKRRLLAELLSKRSAGSPPAPVAVDPQAPFPLNDMQQAFWVGRTGAAQLGNIGIHGYLEIECRALDVARAAAAFGQLVQRHEMLRAVILPDGTQRVLSEVPPLEIPLEDLSLASEPARTARLLELRAQLEHQVFDVQSWPLFHIRAVKLDAALTLLLFSIDLIVVDTRSFVTLFREWAELYRDPQAQKQPLGYTFQQYTRQEPALVSTAGYQRAEAYWTRRIPELPAAPQLPLRIDPSAVHEPRFVRYADVLDAPRWSALKERGKEHGLTPSVLLCTAYVEVLERWSQNAHFTLNVIPSVRRPLHPEVNEVVGPFSAIDLLEIDQRAPATFVERARALQARLYDDLDHMQYNGVKVLRKLAQRHGSGLSALMPIVFTSTMLDLHDLEGLGRIRYMLTQTPQVWIDHQLAERDGALLFNWDVVDELFPPGMVAEMFAAFAARVRALADDEQAFDQVELDVLTQTARAAREHANRTAAPVREALLHEVVWESARKWPEREAVISDDRRMTYGELFCEARQLSRRLKRELGQRNAPHGSLVAISFPKGWQQIVAVLGVLDAGAAYLPLDPSLPKARRELLVEHAGCALLVSAPELVVDLSSGVKQRLVELSASDVAQAGSLPDIVDGEPCATSPDDLAYVIYTSGSTGVPKGVMISHRAALNTLDDINERFAVSEHDRVLALSSLSFDLSVYDVFGLLAVGGAVVLPKPYSERDPAHWIELVQREGITLWNSVPALMRILVEYAGAGRALSSLRLVMLSGDWIPVTLPEAIDRVTGGARVASLGGATEAAIWSIHEPVERVDPEWTSIPYGKPLRNQQFHVRDAALRDCPTWVTGELYIGGVGVAQGYLNDPERTQASFVIDPSSGERLYRTGDLGRYWPDGRIEFLGRRDAQVKISGHRIELEEIDANLVRHPSVRAALVRAAGERHDKRLIAYVELTAGARASDTDAPARSDADMRAVLRDYLAERLPDYMVPRQVVFLERLPLSANGKVDASSLPIPSASEELTSASPDAEHASSAATTDLRDKLERVVLDAWEEVLGQSPVSPNANFFDLGGDSLRMVRVRRLLNERLGCEIPMVELYARPKPTLLASHLVQTVQPAAPSAKSAAAPLQAGQSRAARRLRALGSTEGAQ